MDVDDLVRLINNVRTSAFRLETLPEYLVPQEAEELSSWKAGYPRTPRTPETHEYLAEFQRDVARGIRWYRVHILDQPLTAYLRFELCGYLANQAAGEEIYVVDREMHGDLESLHEDFWLYDDEIAVRMIYDNEGHFLHPEPVDDVERYREMRDTAMRHAEPLDDYLAHPGPQEPYARDAQNDRVNELSDERRRMAEALRELRAAARLSTNQLAQRLAWSQSKVSKTERGVTLPSPSDVEAWANVTGAPAHLRAELIEIAKQAATEFIGWRRFLAPGRRRVQQDVQRLEAAASVLRVFAPNVVVGLAQTRRYAEAVFRMGWGGPAENVDDVVQARLARQAVLADGSKRFELTMGEAALRRRLIPPGAMRVQLIRLVELTRQANVHIGVIRFDAAEKVHQYHGYSVIGDPDLDGEAIVAAETLTRALMVRRDDEIREYIEHFTALRAAATEGEPLRAFLRELIAELPES